MSIKKIIRFVWKIVSELLCFLISIPVSVLFGMGYVIMKVDEFLDGER